jgi:hypothetical protein
VSTTCSTDKKLRRSTAGREHRHPDDRADGGLAFGDATIAADVEREGIDDRDSVDGDVDAVDGSTRLGSVDDPCA